MMRAASMKSGTVALHDPNHKWATGTPRAYGFPPGKENLDAGMLGWRIQERNETVTDE